jgi:hypothetical protein
MKTIRVPIVLAALAMLALLASPFLGEDLSRQDMTSTIGGGNCKTCPGSANNTCTKTSCSAFSSGCVGTSGGSYKVCTQGTHSEQNCLNDDKLTCGTEDSCKFGEGGCTGGNYDCSCHSKSVEVTGCG